MGMIQRASAHAHPYLEPGEQTVTACHCQMKGTLAAGVFGGLAGLLAANQAGKGARERAATAGFPLLQSMMLVPTDRRLLVMDGKKLAGAMNAADVAGAEVVKKNAISPWTVRIDLANGEHVLLEANRGMAPDRLVDAVRALASARR